MELLSAAMDSFAIHLSTQEMPAPFALTSFKPPFDGYPSERSLLKEDTFVETLLLHTRDFSDGVFALLQHHLQHVGADYFRLQIRQENRAVLLGLFNRLDVLQLGFLS